MSRKLMNLMLEKENSVVKNTQEKRSMKWKKQTMFWKFFVKKIVKVKYKKKYWFFTHLKIALYLFL